MGMIKPDIWAQFDNCVDIATRKTFEMEDAIEVALAALDKIELGAEPTRIAREAIYAIHLILE
jgi:hypothetical protein